MRIKSSHDPYKIHEPKKKKKNQPTIKKKYAYLRRKAVGKCNHKLSYVAQIPFVLIIGSLNFEKHKS